jgi:hypothetical protein
MDKMPLEQFFPRVLRFSTVSIIPQLLHTNLSPPHEVCDSPDQAEHNHILGPKLGALSLTWYLAGNRGKILFFNVICNG